jgi:hypothetical protein
MPYMLKNSLFDMAGRARLQASGLPDNLERLRNEIAGLYAIRVLYVEFGYFLVPNGAMRPRLQLIVEGPEDKAKLMKNPFEVRADVRETIQAIMLENVISDEGSAALNSVPLHVVVTDFTQEAVAEAVGRFLDEDARDVAASFEDCHVWRVTGALGVVVVFYRTDNDLVDGDKNGCNDRLAQHCYALVKQYDQFGCLSPDRFDVRFDSKQNLDTNFEGKEFYYFR